MTMTLVEAFAAVSAGPAPEAWATIKTNVEKHARRRARRFAAQRANDDVAELASEIVFRLIRAVRTRGRIPCNATDEGGCHAFLSKVITNRDLDCHRKDRSAQPPPKDSEAKPEERERETKDESVDPELIEGLADASKLNALIERLRVRTREARPKQHRENFDRMWDDAVLLSAQGWSKERVLAERYGVPKGAPGYSEARNTKVDKPQEHFRGYLHQAVQTGEQEGAFTAEEATLLRGFVIGFCSTVRSPKVQTSTRQSIGHSSSPTGGK